MLIPYGKQDINQDDINAVIRVLKSDFLTQGSEVPKFERQVSELCGSSYGVAANSATSALHISCLALGVGSGDLVWTSAITFVASANCAVYCGATVDFLDIDPKTYNVSVEYLEEKLKNAKLSGKLPKVVIPVHLAGQSCDMEKIHKLSLEYGFKIIEDASHAIGGKYKGLPIGNCKYSDITVFSFHPVKIITTGEGGMAVTNQKELHKKMYRLRSHGITRDTDEMTCAPDGPWYYQQLELGYNYRLTDFQAALGLSQIKRLENFILKRHEIANNYNQLLKDFPVTVPWQNKDCYSSYHLYIIRLNLKELAIDHRHVFELFRNAGILVNLHYIPVYRHPYYMKMKFDFSKFPESEKYYAEAISLPIFPTLLKKQQKDIVNLLKKPLGHQTIF